jgi:hypothetical protein
LMLPLPGTVSKPYHRRVRRESEKPYFLFFFAVSAVNCFLIFRRFRSFSLPG